MDIRRMLPSEWREFLAGTEAEKQLDTVAEFLSRETLHAVVYPPREDWFTAFRLTPPENVRAVILGQDPYHGEGQAHGLAFSVRQDTDTPVPPSLRNIFKELESDLGLSAPACGDLTNWAANGVLLLNSVLTVRAGMAGSHAGRGWEAFTDTVIKALAESKTRRVFIFWGAWAGKKIELASAPQHLVLTAPHPSPLSAHRGFFGSKPFSKCNDFLITHGMEPVKWDSLPVNVKQMELGII